MDAREEREKRLKRLKQKRMIMIAALMLVLSAVIGGYFIARQIRIKKTTEEAEKKAQENQSQVHLITQFTLVDATAVEVSNEDADFGFTWIYTNEEQHIGGWVKDGEAEFPTKASAVQQLIDSVCALYGTTKIPAADVEPEKYGLNNSKVRIKVTLKDGTEPAFSFGAAAPYGAGYYMCQETTGDVYVVDSTVYNLVNTKLIDYAMAETFPVAQISGITEVIIEEKGRDTLKYERSINPDGSANFPSIFGDCTSFVASKIVEYNCKDFTKYGLDDPYATITVLYNGHETNENGEDILIPYMMYAKLGNRTESGNFYARVNDSNYVYIMTAAFAEKYLSDAE